MSTTGRQRLRTALRGWNRPPATIDEKQGRDDHHRTAYMLSNRSYFTAATVHGVGNATVGLIYFEVSLPGTIWYAVTAIGVSMVIIAATFGLFGRRFKTKCAEQTQQIHWDREKFSMNTAYSM